MASVTPIRPRKPNRRPASVPAHAPYPFTTPDRMPGWLAVLEEESARRGLSGIAAEAGLDRAADESADLIRAAASRR